MTESRVVSAVASMTSHGEIGAADQNAAADRNARIQSAMGAALVKAQAAGVTDVEELRRVQLEARDKASEG